MPRPAALHVELLHSVFRLEPPDEEVADELRRLWLPLLCEPRAVAEQFRFGVTATPKGWTAWQGPTVLGSHHELPPLLAMLSTHLNSAAITRSRNLVLHAGAVAQGAGVIALAAVSGGGKTTLTAACVALGWHYVTDEALCLRPDGAVLPYPKPLTMSSASRVLLGLDAEREDDGGDVLTTVEELRGRCSRTDRLRVSEVVLLDRSDGQRPDGCELVQLHASEVLTRLLPLSFNHYKQPARSVELLARAALESRAWALRYSDARAAAALLTEAFPQATGSSPRSAVPGRGTPA